MPGHLFPAIPYDEVRSEFIVEEIRSGSFEDRSHRKYVNYLTHVEQYTEVRTWSFPPAMGRSRVFTNWKIATKYPGAYDAVRRELGANTRQEEPITQGWDGEEDPGARRDWARRHRDQWQAAQDGTRCAEEPAVTEKPPSLRSQFVPFRFPRLPYDRLQSEFIVEEIQQGDFDDLEHRRYVNELVYLEKWARDDCRLPHPGTYPAFRGWFIAARNPHEYDVIQGEFDGATRDGIEPISSATYQEDAGETRERRRKQEWRSVQESTGTDTLRK